MNAFAMKLESRQQLTATHQDKSKDLTEHKRCKSLKKRNLTINSDKDALLNSHGLGRKFCNEFDFDNINISISKKQDVFKKNRPKKSGLKPDKMFTESDKIQERLQQSLSNEDKEKIMAILNDVRALSDVQKLFLYLQLPTGSPFEVDPLKQRNLNPLGKKADEEGMYAITWIQSHLEEDPDVSLPKQEVYDEYQSYCKETRTDPLCAADFGKVMKQIFPSVKPRRLGTRGNSRYCYSGLRKKLILAPPSIPDIQKEKENCTSEENLNDKGTAAACHLLLEWAGKLLNTKFSSLKELAAHLLEHSFVDGRSVAAFTVIMDASPQLLTKGSGVIEGGMKKSEAQFHLQRKLQEKELIREQKRRLQEQRQQVMSLGKGNSSSSSSKRKGLKSGRKTSPPVPSSSADEDITGCTDEEKLVINLQKSSPCKDNSGPEHMKCDEISLQLKESETMQPNVSDGTVPEVIIKQEDCFEKSYPSGEDITIRSAAEASSFSSLLTSPLSSPSGDVEDFTKRKNKTMIQQVKPPVCIAPSIIIVPSLPKITADVGKQNLPKYKRIQPKPLHGDFFNTIARSRAGSVGSSIPNKPKTRNADGRRSSHAWLQSEDFGEISEEKQPINGNTSLKGVQEKHPTHRNGVKDTIRFETPHIGKSVSENLSNNSEVLFEKRKKISEIHAKPRHIVQPSLAVNNLTEVEDGSSVKRHLDEKDEHVGNKRVHLELLEESAWIPNSANHSTSQASSNKHSGIGHEEVNVHEIEGDALNDYFRGANGHSSINSFVHNELEQQLSSTNKLSQLRMLLEQNLPSATSKAISVSSVKSQKGSKSDTSESLLLSSLSSDTKKSYSALLQDANKTLMSNPVFENPIDVNSLKTDPQMDSLEKLLSSSYLAAGTEDNMDSQLLSDPSMFLTCPQTNVQDMDVSLHGEFNQNSATSDILLSSNLLSDAELVSEQVNSTLQYSRVNTCTQVPSVPQSPNTRRRAFNFMPISPRHTPVPDSVPMNGTVSSPHLRTMMSTGVGPSQPPSNSGSPFVSPRSTPVPLSRSRHSSGQSTYSTSRHTPFQNFDSGVSSVSSSPFISPQPTPVPVSRLRHNSSHGTNKTVTFCSINSPQVMHGHPAAPGNMRMRHSSGPGGAHVVNSSPRSTSLSPLVVEQSSSFVFPSNNEMRSRHNSGSNTTTPLSPVSEQASSSSSCASNVPDLSSDITLSASQSFMNDAAGDLLISANPSSFKQVRHRHASSSVIYGKSPYVPRDIFSQEIQKLLKNSQDTSASELLLSNRSQSVPLHQMLQTSVDGFCFVTNQPIEDPKSHPSTPIMNQMFSFPTLSSSGQEAVEKSIVQNSQMEWTGFDGPTVELETGASVRRNLAMLYDTAPLSDDLQTTLEDLRDCDTDFSKLELELSQSEECGL